MTHEVCSFGSTGNITLPTANQYCELFNSTTGMVDRVANSTSLSGAGNYRGKFPDARLKFTVGSTGQDVTLVRQILDSSGTFQTVASDTLTAGTLYPYDWLPQARDFRVYVLAGGTGPTTLLFEGSLTIGDRASG